MLGFEQVVRPIANSAANLAVSRVFAYVDDRGAAFGEGEQFIDGRFHGVVSYPGMDALNGKIALITGANRGIGAATAKRFHAAGAQLVLVVRDETKRKRVRQALGTERVAVEIADIGDSASVRALATRVSAAFGRVDILINNAAVFLDADREMRADLLDPAVMQATLAVNVVGTVAMCTAFAPLIPSGGRIINISSTMGQLADGLWEKATAYSVSKTALNAYTNALAAALAPRSIMADSMHPGWVKTEMGGAGAQIEPEAATETALFLATRPASPATGRFWFESKEIAW